MQCQYCSRYLDPKETPYLGEGIRWKGNVADFHFMEIHKDDVEEFVKRVLEYRRAARIV
jgi:hypothetical protein